MLWQWSYETCSLSKCEIEFVSTPPWRTVFTNLETTRNILRVLICFQTTFYLVLSFYRNIIVISVFSELRRSSQTTVMLWLPHFSIYFLNLLKLLLFISRICWKAANFIPTPWGPRPNARSLARYLDSLGAPASAAGSSGPGCEALTSQGAMFFLTPS